MLHACVQRFDVTENLKNLAKFSGTKLDLPWICSSQVLPPTQTEDATPFGIKINK